MRLVHFSDWHAGTTELPPADVYVCTGDMLPNFPVIRFDNGWGPQDEWRPGLALFGEMTQKPDGWMMRRELQPDEETRLQRRWIAEKLGSYRKLMASPEAPVLVVRGNHDFTDLAPAFSGGGPVYELGHDPRQVVTIGGKVFGACRGIPYIAGEWSDEMEDSRQIPTSLVPDGRKPPVAKFADCLARVPAGVDVMLTHCPPAGVLDTYPASPLEDVSIGSGDYLAWLNERCADGSPPVACLFGHVHESRGQYRGQLPFFAQDIHFSNAATGVETIDL